MRRRGERVPQGSALVQLEDVQKGCNSSSVVRTSSPVACWSSEVELFDEEMGKSKEEVEECGSLTGN